MTSSTSTSGTLDVENGTLYYEVAGDEHSHPLLLIHAAIADNRMWDDQFELFAQRYRVIRYDMRGFGKSFVEDGASFSNRQDILALFDHLGARSAYVMGGSRGGQIAADFTVEHPAMVDALVLVAAGLSGWDGAGYAPTDEEMRLGKREEELWEAKDWEGLADNDVQLWVDGPGQPAGRAPQQVRERVRAMSLNNYATHTTEGKPRPLQPPTAGRLGEVHVPTLVIAGALDPSDTDVVANLLVKGIPNARKVVMAGTAHVPNMEKPDEFNRLVLDFLGGVK
jgi:pimeloyl-ACP methyl ester carboxylesterase